MQKLVLRLCVSLTGLFVLLVPVSAFAWSPFGGVDCSKAATSTVCTDSQSSATSNPLVGPNGVIVKATKILALVAGAAAVIIIIISGLRFILANGDSNAVNSARNAILYSIVGLVVIILAQAFIVFVVKRI